MDHVDVMAPDCQGKSIEYGMPFESWGLFLEGPKKGAALKLRTND